MNTRILIPLDGSTLAEQALPCATMLAASLPGHLVLFRAVSLASDVKEVLADADLTEEVPMAPLVAEANDYLSQVARNLEGTEINVSTGVRCGPAAEGILDYVEQEGIQWIVMATHGYSGISRWVHGSVAERVLQSATIPILLVRAHEDAAETPYEPRCCHRILVPLDGSRMAEQVLPPAVSVAKALDAEIVLFRVPTVLTSMSLAGEGYLPLESLVEVANQDARSYLDSVAQKIEEQAIPVSTDLRIGGVANAIIEYAEANEIDLIAMCTHGRTGLARWAFGSVADRVLRAGGTPLLVVRAR